MPLKIVILWTDALIYLLLLATACWIAFAVRRTDIRIAWHQIFTSRLAVIAFTVLFTYFSIAILDSIHYRSNRNASTSHSVLDYLLSPLGERDEKTYSAPFATHSYMQETREKMDGTFQSFYPRLLYGGIELKNSEQDRRWHIAIIMLHATFKAFIKGIILASLLTGLAFLCRYKTTIRWRLLLFSGSVMILILQNCIDLSMHYHILGTDKIGNDTFYESIKSIRTGVVIGTVTTLSMLPFAVLLGLLAGYFKGWIDDVIQYIYTTLSSIPGVLLIAAAILSLQVYITRHSNWFLDLESTADARLLALCLVLGATSWTSLCRMLRGETLKIREMNYVQAAYALGATPLRIILRHILPNVMHIILIAIVLDFSALVLAEAVLSYVGVGVDPTTISWGNMINSARLEIAREPIVWWPLTAAFIFMFLFILAANLFADVVREAFDPRIRKIKGE